jgi:hypothetical protein
MMCCTKYKLPSLLPPTDRLIWIDCEMTGLGMAPICSSNLYFGNEIVGCMQFCGSEMFISDPDI